ncbi:MAG: hypothetical protein AAF585_23945 [Verrucomicrobiota bacterium]
MDAFWEGVSSYFWEPVEAEIITSELSVNEDWKGSGTVEFRLVDHNANAVHEAHIDAEWTFKRQERSKKWRDRYCVGSRHTAYVSESGKSRLGHWPSKAERSSTYLWWAVLVVGISLVVEGIRDHRLAKSEATGAAEEK